MRIRVEYTSSFSFQHGEKELPKLSAPMGKKSDRLKKVKDRHVRTEILPTPKGKEEEATHEEGGGGNFEGGECISHFSGKKKRVFYHGRRKKEAPRETLGVAKKEKQINSCVRGYIIEGTFAKRPEEGERKKKKGLTEGGRGSFLTKKEKTPSYEINEWPFAQRPEPCLRIPVGE